MNDSPSRADLFGMIFHPSDTVELRAFGGDYKGGIGITMAASELDTRGADWIAQKAREGADVYFGVNPRTLGKASGANGCCTGADVQLARVVCADIDNGVTVDEAHRRVRDAGIVAPTATVASGGGVHLYWRLDEPCIDLSLWTRMQKALIKALDADACLHDAGRVIRVADSLNRRRNARCRVVELHPARQYALDDLGIVPLAPEPPAAVRDRSADEAQTVGDDFNTNGDLAEVLTRHGWRRCGSSGGNEQWTRPGKDGGVSATFNGQTFYVFSSNAEPFKPGTGYAPFTVYAMLDHAGDFKAAARSWAESRREQVDLSELEIGTTPTIGDEPDEPEIIDEQAPFPIDLMPKPVRDFVRDGAKALGCDPSMLALPSLVAMGAMVGNSRQLVVKSGSWYAKPILWGAVVAKSGAMKSPPLDLVMKPIRQLEKRLRKQYAEELARYEQLKAEHDNAVNEQKRNRGKPNPEDEGEEWKRGGESIVADFLVEPEHPKRERALCNNTTIEELAALLSESPRGLLNVRDELSAWFGSFNRYSNGKSAVSADEALWLEAYDGAPWIVDRRKSDQLFVPSAAVSLVGTIQPGVLARALTDQHRQSGLAARLLLIAPTDHQRVWTDYEVEQRTLDAMGDVFDQLRTMEPFGVDDGEMVPRNVRMSPEAKALWTAFYNQHNAERMRKEDDAAAAWSKLEGVCVRLALILHCARFVAGETADEFVVDEPTMESAVELTRWFCTESERVYAMLSEGAGPTVDRELVAWMRSKPNGLIRVRDAYKSGPSRYRNKEAALKIALDAIEDAKLGKWEYPKVAGNQPRMFRVFY